MLPEAAGSRESVAPCIDYDSADQRGGIYPYVRQFSKSGASVYRCPSGQPDRSGYVSVSSTYAMNDYLRPRHGRYPADVPHEPLGLAQIEMPARTILLFEVTQNRQGYANRNGSPYFHTVDRETGRPVGVPQIYHHGGSNFLFCDGHARFHHPRATMTRERTPTEQRYLTEGGTLVVGFQLGWAADAEDMWRPFAGYGDSLPCPPGEAHLALRPPHVRSPAVRPPPSALRPPLSALRPLGGVTRVTG
jgi:prepilin-type processing-associated H-X9-DG protein